MKLYHIHFRKTGGTALRRVLLKEMKPAAPLSMFSDMEFFAKVPAAKREETIAGCDFISGHFGRLGPLVTSDFAKVCVLRDPLRRIVSGFNHMQGDPRDPMHDAIKSLDFCQAIDQATFAPELWNHQSRIIVENAGEKFDALSDKQRIECCMTFLTETVTCFGVLEHPDRLMADLNDKIGLKLPTSLPTANQDVTARGVHKLVIHNCMPSVVMRNRIDLAVYSYALSQLGY